MTTGASLLGGPAASPDGATLAFARSKPAVPGGEGASSQVMLYTLATKTFAVLSATDDSEAAFAPKGGVVGVTSTRFDVANPELVLFGLDGSAPFRLTTSPGVDGEIAFRPSP